MQILSARVASYVFPYFYCEDNILKKSANKISDSSKEIDYTVLTWL